MSEILLIRHGQASFGTSDYDTLSELGIEQARLVGDYLASSGIHLNGIFCGTLQRQRQTADIVIERYRRQGVELPPAQSDAAFNELDNEAQIRLLAPRMALNDEHAERLIARAHTSKKDFQKLLKAVFEAWQNGSVSDDRLESWSQFKRRVLQALSAVREEQGGGSTSAIFTSGGVIATLVADALCLPDTAVYSVFEPVINCSVTRLLCNAERLSLSSYNEFSFLQCQAGPAMAEQVITYR